MRDAFAVEVDVFGEFAFLACRAGGVVGQQLAVHAEEFVGLDAALGHAGAFLVAVVGVLDAASCAAAVRAGEVGRGVVLVGLAAGAGDVAQRVVRTLPTCLAGLGSQKQLKITVPSLATPAAACGK